MVYIETVSDVAPFSGRLKGVAEFKTYFSKKTDVCFLVRWKYLYIIFKSIENLKYSHVFNQIKKNRNILLALPLGMTILGFSTPVIGADAPSKQFITKDIYIGSILFEWYKKNPNVPSYACICLKAECDNSQSWPFRRFGLGKVVPALGSFNKRVTESLGFKCSKVAPKEFLEGIGD